MSSMPSSAASKWSGSALFAYVPQKRRYAYMVNCTLAFMCLFFSSIPRGAMGLSVICDYGSYSLALF